MKEVKVKIKVGKKGPAVPAYKKGGKMGGKKPCLNCGGKMKKK